MTVLMPGGMLYKKKFYWNAKENRLRTTDLAQKMSKRLVKKICIVDPLEINSNLLILNWKRPDSCISCMQLQTFFLQLRKLLFHFQFHLKWRIGWKFANKVSLGIGGYQKRQITRAALQSNFIVTNSWEHQKMIVTTLLFYYRENLCCKLSHGTKKWTSFCSLYFVTNVVNQVSLPLISFFNFDVMNSMGPWILVCYDRKG